jgi:tetratricopeptide (TPR) repeat protein
MSTSAANPPPSQLVGALSDSSFTQQVNEALRTYTSTLALSRSPLANSPLVAPTLVKDEASPTAEERGYGLRLVLQWAIAQLAPVAPEYPLGEYRPLDDPTWRDPRWWRYNILRHRYLEPLHPDDFVGGGRFTESLLALTGISSTDAFFDERNRAVREVAERLRQQLIDGQASDELQRMALQEVLAPLKKQEDALRLLGVAATFDDIFARTLLMELALHEQIGNPALALDRVLQQRFLLTGDEGANLWLAPILRTYVYERQLVDDRARRHRLVAAHYEAQAVPIKAAHHWRCAGQDDRAVRVLLPAAAELIHELQVRDLIELLQHVEVRRLAREQWYQVQILLSDLYQRSGQHEEALTACRKALKATDDPNLQACVYRRMGKLYEKRNQLHALGYYNQAAKLFEPDHPELPFLFKDRGWLHILRQSWQEAEADLMRASSVILSTNVELSADIADALASLYRRQQRYDSALQEAQRSLILREKSGDLFRVAASFNNLGIIYRGLEEYWQAISAYNEALATYRKLGNQDSIAGALMNIGSAYFLLRQPQEAIINYQKSLEICQQVNLPPHTEATARYNLAEAYMAIDQQQLAFEHWQQGYNLSLRFGFVDEIAAFEGLRAELSILRQPGIEVAAPNANFQLPSDNFDLSKEEQTILKLVRTHRQLTARVVVEEMSVSRATATRWLASLTEQGYLVKHGEGRGTYYTVALPPARPQSTAPDAQLVATDIVESLRSEQATLTTQYAVAALGFAVAEPPTRFAKIIVRFAQLPDLAGYLHLKTQLATLLQMEIDLIPEVSAASATLPEQTNWVWS